MSGGREKKKRRGEEGGEKRVREKETQKDNDNNSKRRKKEERKLKKGMKIIRSITRLGIGRKLIFDLHHGHGTDSLGRAIEATTAYKNKNGGGRRD